MENPSETFIASLSQEGRVLLLGGLAVIAHGLSRSTRDVDVWFEPYPNVAEWANRLRRVLAKHADAKPYDLKNKCVVGGDLIDAVIARDGVIRVAGLDRPIDIFRIPHNLTAEDFADVWAHAATQIIGTRLPDEIDLLVTKEGTSRHQDLADIAFLEDKIRGRLCRQLQSCPFAEAEAVFRRYVDHATCRAALKNSDAKVRELALTALRRFSAAGDPFAREILDGQHG